MKTPKQHGLTMQQLEGYKKISKGGKKRYWQGRIDAFKGKHAYQRWLKWTKKNK